MYQGGTVSWWQWLLVAWGASVPPAAVVVGRAFGRVDRRRARPGQAVKVFDRDLVRAPE